MIDRKLQVLSSYIDTISKKNTIDLIGKYLQMFPLSEIEETRYDEKDTRFLNALDTLFGHYDNGNMTDEEKIRILIMSIRSLLMKYLIFQKARALSIDSLLYKKEMGFLFKGKPLD